MRSTIESSVSKASVEKTEGIRNNVEIIQRNTNSVDIISQLPDDVIMHIFSFLTMRDIIATCTLGKIWARISSRFKPNPKHYVENKADKFLESYKNQGVRVMSYSFSIHSPSKYSAQINDWLQLVAENNIYVLHVCFGPSSLFSFRTNVSLSDSLVVLVLQDCSLKGLTSSLKLHSLQELILERVELADLCSSFVSIFYNIRKLRLRYISNLYCFCFNRLDRLELLEISSVYSMSSRRSLSPVTCLCCRPFSPNHYYDDFLSDIELRLQGCNNLETFCFHATIIDRGDKIRLPKICNLNNRPRLKKLVLHGIFKMGTKEFIIDHDTLKVLHLSCVDDMACPVIITPRLHTFKFKGNAFEPFLFKMNTGRTLLRKISFEFSEACPIDAIWFLKLGLFVRKYGQDGVLSLRITKDYLVCKSLGKFRRLPICKLKHLKVKDVQKISPLSCKLLINGLLWGFRPESLAMILTKEPREYIKVIQKHLQHEKGSSRKCCGSAPSRCWKHGLKHAEIEFSSVVSKKMPFKDLFKLNIKFQWGED